MAAVNENPVCDSALMSMFEEFEEGTLLSLLDDGDFFSYLQHYPLLPGADAEESTSDDLDLSQLFGGELMLPECLSAHHNSEAVDNPMQEVQVEGNLPDTKSSDSLNSYVDDPQATPPSPVHSGGSETDVSYLDSNDSDTADDGFSITSQPAKRCKLESSEQDRLFLSGCVEHDHCYARAQQPQSPGDSTDRDVLQVITSEEGNTSDAGYDTMSSSMSPGTSAGINRSPHCSPVAHQASPLPTLPHYNTPHLNPVALIDARIKHFMQSQQVNLTEEEKETLKAEGLPIPTTLPLTKVEEKALKSVRRKIRNKVAAQESRKRKKEHTQELEEKVRQYTNHNLRLQKKVETLESENRSLMAQLQKFKTLVAGSSTSRHTTKVGACLMVIVLCFAVLLGGWAPQKHVHWSTISSDYATSSVRSRSLLSLEAADTTFPQAVCNWFHYTFLHEQHVSDKHSDPSSHHTPDPDYTWPDIYLSSYTPLTVQAHNDSHDTSGSATVSA